MLRLWSVNREETNVCQPGLFCRFHSYTFLLWTIFILSHSVWKCLLCYSTITVFHSSASVKNKVIRCYMYICSCNILETFLTSAVRRSRRSLCCLSMNLLVSCVILLRLYARISYLTSCSLRSQRFLWVCTLAILQLTTHYSAQGYSFQLSFIFGSLALSTITCSEQYTFYYLLYVRVLCFCGQNIKIIAV